MAWNRLFAKKPMQVLMAESTGEQHLRRVLGPVGLTSLGVGAIIGAGIFVLTGQAAAQYAGPGIVLSFIISGIGCAFAGLCYAEMASMIPIAGSAYTYSYATMGEFLAWIIGWDLILEYSLGATTVSIGWSGYIVSFLKDFNIVFPTEFTSAPLAYDPKTHIWSTTGAVFNLPAVIIVVLITGLLVVGIKESATVNSLIVIVKVIVVLVFIAAGAAFISRANWDPFIPENTGHFGIYGFSGVLRGAGVIFFAYIGFDAVSTAAQEARNPQRDLPIGILGSLAVCTILYIVVAGVLTGIVSYTALNVPDPIAVGVNSIQWPAALAWLSPVIKFLVKIGAIAGLSSVILVMLLSQPRIFWTMSRDGLLPQFVAKVHPRFRTPYITTIITGGLVALAAAVLPISIAGELVSIGTLLAFVLVCAGVLTLRCTQPGLRRPFRCSVISMPEDVLKEAERGEIIRATVTSIVWLLFAEGAAVTWLLGSGEIDWEGIGPEQWGIASYVLLALGAAALVWWLLEFGRSVNKRVFLESAVTAFICLHGILVCLAQMAALPGDTWKRLIYWMALGLLIYFAYGFWFSKVSRQLDTALSSEAIKEPDGPQP